MIILLFVASLFAQTPQTIYKNNTAVDLLSEEGKSFEARQILQNTVIENPDVGELKYNYGQSFEKANEPEEAIREYLSSAKKTKDGDLQFQAFFNAARLYGEKKDVPNALKYYQMALDLKPDSIETKTNIELLIQTGGGGGGGQDNQQSKNNDQEQKDQEQQGDQKKDQQGQGPKKLDQRKQPQQFKSKELNEQDVRNILEELKRQENQVRKKINDQKTQESPIGKDW